MDAAEPSPERGDAPRSPKVFLFRDPSPRESLIWGIALALLAALPVLLTAVPQMTDYASHLARYHVMLDGEHDPFLARFYAFEWRWNGNLGADLLIWPFARLFGLEAGARIMTALIPALTGLGIVTVEWTLRRRVGAGSLLAMATIWSPALLMGFLNFCLSLAAALFAFALWVRLDGKRWRWVLFVPISLVVWLCHMSGWGVLGIMVFAYEFHRRRGLGALWAPWPLLPPIVPVLLLGGATKGALDFGKNPLLYKRGIFLQAMRDQSSALDTNSLYLILLVFLVALVLRRIDWRLGMAAVLLALLAVVMPRHFGGGDYADYRLISVALLVGGLAVNKVGPRLLLILAAALFVGRLAVTTEAWLRTDRETARVLAALDRLPEGAIVAGAVLVERQDWRIDPLQHLPSYVTIRRNGLVNTHFAIPGVHMLSLREGGEGFIDPSHRVFHRPGEAVDLSRFAPAQEADYLWYVGKIAPARLPAGAEVILRNRDTLLAKLPPPPPSLAIPPLGG